MILVGPVTPTLATLGAVVGWWSETTSCVQSPWRRWRHLTPVETATEKKGLIYVTFDGLERIMSRRHKSLECLPTVSEGREKPVDAGMNWPGVEKPERTFKLANVVVSRFRLPQRERGRTRIGYG